MSNLNKVLRALAVLALAAVLGTLIGWLVSRRGDVTPVAAPPPVSTPLAVAPMAAQPAPETSPAGREPAHVKFSRHLDQGAADWEQQLDDILLGDDDDNGKADKILALIPRAPAAAQQELAQHLVNMVQDDHYDGAAELLTNADTSPEVSGVLMNDLLNRSNSLKLPMLLAIASNSSHPLKDQALDLLGLLTQADNGTNWDQWASTIDTWLQDNPQ
ncbi:MAG: hypothetical protein ACLQU4_12295 [Limisphaerales bacterium]